MKRTMSLFVVLTVAFVLLAAPRALAQEKVPVKVKGSEVITGVVVVHVQKDAKSLDLQCTQGVGNCTALSSGNYLMVQLPPNFGMYDCKNVELYRGDPEKPQAAERVGAYCLMEK